MWYHDAWRLSVSISCVVRNIDVCNGFSTWFYVTHFKWALIIFHWSFTWFHISYGSNLEVYQNKCIFPNLNQISSRMCLFIWCNNKLQCERFQRQNMEEKTDFQTSYTKCPLISYMFLNPSSNCWNDYSEINWIDWKQT